MVVAASVKESIGAVVWRTQAALGPNHRPQRLNAAFNDKKDADQLASGVQVAAGGGQHLLLGCYRAGAADLQVKGRPCAQAD
jgi:hypothetical protein